MSTDTEASTSNKSKDHVDVTFYRKLVRQLINMRRYQSALFWAEKVCVLSLNEPRDVYYQAQAMYLLGEYHRAAHVLKHFKLEKTSLPCFNLYLESLYAAKQYAEAATVIQTVDIEFMITSLINQPIDSSGAYIESSTVFGGEECNRNELLASIFLLKGKVFEALDNRGTAMDFYVQALHKSIYCYEALEALVQHEMLMAWEERDLMDHLPFSQQCSEADAKLILTLYETKLKKYYKMVKMPTSDAEENPISNPDTIKYINDINERIQKYRKNEPQVHKNPITVPTTTTTTQPMSPAQKVLEDLKTPNFSLQASLSRATSMDATRTYLDSFIGRRTREVGDVQNFLPLTTCFDRIKRSVDVIASEAEQCFYDCDYRTCSKILSELFKLDPFHMNAMTIQIGAFVESGEYNKLFYVAHKLVDRYPDKAISWYAVGCYYDLIGKSDPARRYLSKATTLDKLYGPAWLAYGHSFAKENEHDQAMAAYFKATQLMRGCHFPLLYIGVECGLTKNVELAEKFFFQSMTIAPLDVYVLHELGVIKYEYEYYESAAIIFQSTVDIIEHRAKVNQEQISERWQPLYTNLGHCCRKLKKYEKALENFQTALLLRPLTATTYTAMGFVHALMWNLDEAIDLFHKSLALSRDCIVTSTILKTCIEDYMDDAQTIDDICGKAMSVHTGTIDTKSNTKSKIDDEDIGSTNSDSCMVMDVSLDMSLDM